jgi:hypothetical protein
VEALHEDTRTERKFSMESPPSTRARTMGVSGQQFITLFLIFGLFLSTGWGGLITLVTVALRQGVQDARGTVGNNSKPRVKGATTKDASKTTKGLPKGKTRDFGRKTSQGVENQ